MPPLIQMFVFVALAGLVLWLINKFIPMKPEIANILNTGAYVVIGIIVAVTLIAWVCGVFGWSSGLQSVKLW